MDDLLHDIKIMRLTNWMKNGRKEKSGFKLIDKPLQRVVELLEEEEDPHI